MNQEPLLVHDADSSESLQIVHSDVEGQTTIISIQGLKLNKGKLCMAILYSILTCFMFTLICTWSKKLIRIFLFDYCSPHNAQYFWVQNSDSKYSICKIQKSQQVFFINRKLKYIYYEEQNVVKPLEYQIESKSKKEIIQIYKNDVINVQSQFDLYGLCQIYIPIPSIFQFLAKELTTPFYLLQYLSCVLWVVENYAILSIIMISISIVLSSINYFLLLQSMKKLRKMAKNDEEVTAIRNQQRIQIQSQELVPGDKLIIKNKSQMPCDCILIDGKLLMNEASLTGESVPIPKFPLEDIDEYFSFNTDKRNCLFEGTKVLFLDCECIGLVVRTGFCSFKGQIFRSVLYPKAQTFEFYLNSIKFFLGLAIYIMIWYFALLGRMISIELEVVLIVFRFFDAFFWIVPPALPIFVSMCQTYALLRLKRKRIFGVDPQKAVIAGEINTICFDKTGTLTTIGLEIIGYQIVEHNAIVEKNVDQDDLIYKIFGSCHGAYMIDGELQGDILDIQMFKYSGYKKIDGCYQNDSDIKLKVLKEMEFESQYQRMTVIVLDVNSNQHYVFTKGSPEKISELISRQPSNFKMRLEELTLSGHRVLALAYKKVSNEEIDQLLISSRQLIEGNLIMVGLLILENPLKQDTSQIIEQLSDSGLDLKIISGDNPLTTIQCARTSNLIQQEKPVLLIDYDDQKQCLILEQIENTKKKQSTQESMTSLDTQDTQGQVIQFQQNNHKLIMKRLIDYLIISEQTIKINHIQDKSINQSNQNLQAEQKYVYAITGKAFDYFWAQNPSQYRSLSFAGFENPLTNVDQLEYTQDDHLKVFNAVILSAKIFARMRPEQKSQVVEKLQILERKVAMVGDGANDCSAIQQANVGISFAQADAAFSAPFCSSGESINCVYRVLLEGRACLTSTMEVFQFYVTVSVYKFVSCMLLMTQGGNYSTLQLLFINYIGTLPFLKGITLTPPSQKLTNKLPESNMYAIQNQITMYNQIIIASAGMFCNYLYWNFQGWSNHINKLRDGTYIMKGQLQTTIFLTIHLYFLASLISFYISSPFKIRFYKHILLVVMFVIVFLIFILFFFTYEWWYTDYLQIVRLNSSYLKNQFLISIGFCILMVLSQELIVKRKYPCVKELMSKKRRKQRKNKNKKVNEQQ